MPTLREEPEWLTKALQTGAAKDLTPRPPLDPIEAEIDDKAAEKAFQADVIKFARKNGWKHYHTYDSRRSAKGFPDLVLVRGGRLIFAELKSATGRMMPDQEEWIAALSRVGPIEVYLWRPSDWPQIVAILEGSGS